MISHHMAEQPLQAHLRGFLPSTHLPVVVMPPSSGSLSEEQLAAVPFSSTWPLPMCPFWCWGEDAVSGFRGEDVDTLSAVGASTDSARAAASLGKAAVAGQNVSRGHQEHQRT